MAKAAKKTAGGGGNTQKRGSTYATLAILIATILSIMAPPLAMVLLAGLLPSLAAFIVDRQPARYLTRTIVWMNFAGVIALLSRLWTGGISFEHAIEALSNPFSWLLMYGAAGMGWLIFYSTPPIARMMVDARADKLQKQLRERAKKLKEEWGDDVTGQSR